MRRTEAESGGADSWTMVDPLEQKNNKRKNSTAHQTKRGGAHHDSPAKFLMGIPP